MVRVFLSFLNFIEKAGIGCRFPLHEGRREKGRMNSYLAPCEFN